MARYEIIRIKEHSHPQDFSRLFLCQIAVDGRPCVPFWSHVAQRAELGEEAWIASLYENAEHLLLEYGPAPALSP
jgi:hypothetical protein